MDKSVDVDAYVAGLEGEIKNIVVALRRLISGVDGQLRESLKWNSPVYSCKRNLFSIMAHNAHVNLQIFRGVELAENNDRGFPPLVGTGKAMRHLKIASLEDLDPEAVSKLINAAIDLDQD